MPHDWGPRFEPPGDVALCKKRSPYDYTEKMYVLEDWNREKIFIAETGYWKNWRNVYVFGRSGEIMPMYDIQPCWREKEDGSRERVIYYPFWGWASDEEVAEYRDLFERYGNR